MTSFQIIAFRYKDRHFWYAVAGVVLSLYLLAFLALRYMQQNALALSLRVQIPFSIVLRESAPPAQIFEFQKELTLHKAIQGQSVRFIDKAAAWEELNGELLRGDTLAVDSAALLAVANPLPDVIEFRLQLQGFEQLPSLLDWIRSRPFVEDIWYSEDLVAPFLGKADTSDGKAMREAVSRVEWGAMSLFLLSMAALAVAWVLWRNTLRAHALENTALLEHLSLLGAQPDFVPRLYARAARWAALWAILVLWALMLLSQWSLSTGSEYKAAVDYSLGYVFLYFFVAATIFLIFTPPTFEPAHSHADHRFGQ